MRQLHSFLGQVSRATIRISHGTSLLQNPSIIQRRVECKVKEACTSTDSVHSPPLGNSLPRVEASLDYSLDDHRTGTLRKLMCRTSLLLRHTHNLSYFQDTGPHVRAVAARTVAVAAVLCTILLAEPASANETGPSGFFQLIIETVEALGSLGPVVFIATVGICECIPLFPTQPLSLASGLLFGAQKGAIYMLSGTTTAAILAFIIARGVGRPLAEKIIAKEVTTSEDENDASNPIGNQLTAVRTKIANGSFAQQALAVFLLRMTPVVPFSASNYVLGLSPLPILPYLVGTVAGMSFWSVGYASLGGASRALLKRGVSADTLLADMIDRAGQLSGNVALAGLVGALLAAGAFAYKAFSFRPENEQQVNEEGRNVEFFEK